MKYTLPWIGSKKRLAPIIVQALSEIKDAKNKTFVEPFGGAANVLFTAKEAGFFKDYYLKDANESLINFYMSCRGNWDDLHSLEVTDENWNELRKMGPPYGSTLFFTLLMHSYGNMWRVNSKGIFNNPRNKKLAKDYTASAKVREKIILLRQALQGVEISQDYWSPNEYPIKNAVYYIDPPYVESGHTYAANAWTDNWQVLLEEWAANNKQPVICSFGHESPLLTTIYRSDIANALSAPKGNKAPRRLEVVQVNKAFLDSK